MSKSNFVRKERAMRNCRRAGSAGCAVLSAIFLCLGVRSGQGQMNVWTNSASGYWEEPHWSLGMLPGTNQIIEFTNAWQALAIGASTVTNHPETLSVWSVTLAAPPNSFNELLLNFAGLQSPFMPQRLMVYSNSGVVALSSALGTSNSQFSIGGAFNQGSFSRVTAQILNVGDVGPGVYNLTNGSVSATESYVGAFQGNPGYGLSSRFNQFGGTNMTALWVIPGGAYNLFDGIFEGDVMCWGEGFTGSSFNQSGGSFSGELHLLIGNYTLSGGTFSTPGLLIPYSLPSSSSFANGSFLQTGGTNFCGSLLVTSGDDGSSSWFGGYTLSNGVLLVSGPETLGGLVQSGGTHTNAGMILSGNTSLHGSYGALYNLNGGTLSTTSIGLSRGEFTQSGGTNQVNGDINISGGGGLYDAISTFTLSGGLLCDANMTLGIAQRGQIIQSGGTHIISNLLSVTGVDFNYPVENYTLRGGILSVPNIRLVLGVFVHTAGTVTNQGTLTLANGAWNEGTDGQEFGALQLETGSSSLSLPAGACVLHFAASSGMVWSNAVTLSVENWNGSVDGGGKHRIIFGTDSSALTAQQLSQIQFHNPAGSVGTYPARMLSNGEIVPGRFLSVSRFQMVWF